MGEWMNGWVVGFEWVSIVPAATWWVNPASKFLTTGR